MLFVTETYRHSAAECGRRATIDFLEKWWWAFALPLACALIASLWDWRWLVAGMALALVAYPFVLMMAYYTRALTPEAAKGMLNRHVEFEDTGIKIVYEPFEEGERVIDVEDIPYSSFSHFEICDGSFALKGKAKELSIPLSAIDVNSTASLTSFLRQKGLAQA